MATPASITSIPSTVRYVFNLFASTYPRDANNVPTMVWFGTELGAFSAPTTIEINAVDPADQEPAEMGPNYKREELYSLKCRVSVYSGGGTAATDFLARMDDCFTVWKALEIAVANDPTLGNNVRYAEFGEMEYTPGTDGKGNAMGCLTWSVRCSQRVTSLS